MASANDPIVRTSPQQPPDTFNTCITMIFRLWHASIQPRRVDEFDAFVQQHATPMFQQMPGFLGVFYLHDQPNVVVLTLWADMPAAKALTNHSLYQNVVANLQATGILRDMKGVSYYTATDGLLLHPTLFQNFSQPA